MCEGTHDCIEVRLPLLQPPSPPLPGVPLSDASMLKTTLNKSDFLALC